MSRFPERERGTTLRLLDLSRAEAMCLTAAQEADPEKPPTRMEAGFAPWGVGVKEDGTIVAVCCEGVGYEVTDENPLQIGMYPRWDKSFGIMPSWIATLRPSDLQEYLTNDTIDLADLIRSFGQRLEDNFWRLRGLLASGVRV